MSVPAIPQYCGQAMTIVQSKMKCLGCGYEMPVPGEVGLGEKPPIHCGLSMVVVRDLKCDVCGYATSDTVRLEVPPATPVTPPPTPLPRRKRIALQPITVTDLVGIEATWELASESYVVIKVGTRVLSPRVRQAESESRSVLARRGRRGGGSRCHRAWTG